MLSEEVEEMLRQATPGECVMCSKQANARCEVVLTGMDGRPTGRVLDLETCWACLVVISQQPSFQWLDSGDA